MKKYIIKAMSDTDSFYVGRPKPFGYETTYEITEASEYTEKDMLMMSKIYTNLTFRLINLEDIEYLRSGNNE